MLGQSKGSLSCATKKANNKIKSLGNDVEDDLISLVDTSSTVCTSSESIQLSLPDNFDDVFSINGISVAPIKCTSAELRLLHAQIVDLRSQVKHLTDDRETFLGMLQSLDTNAIFENHYQMEQTSEAKRSLLHHASLILKRKLAKHHDELRIAIENAKTSGEIAEQKNEKATNAQIIYEQRIANMQEALDAANERRKESDEKCKNLQEKVIEIEEKGRKFDDMTSQFKTLEHECKRMRGIIDQRQKDMESSKVESETMKTEVKNLTSQIHALEMDKSFVEKEKTLLLKQVQDTETRYEKAECMLREANARLDDISLQLSNASAIAKAESEAQASIEIKRIRSECDEELRRYRTQVETSYKRELTILRDTKEEATKQGIEAQRQVVKLREDLEKTSSQKDDTIKRLEKSLSAYHSDMKIKCIEYSKLQLCNEQLEQNEHTLKTEVRMLSAQVDVHKNEFKNLEQESSLQRKQLMDEIERKDDQLEMYYESQLKSFHSQEAKQMMTCSSNKVSMHHFLEKAKELEKKNSDLLKATSHLKKEMKKQGEKNTIYQMKLKNSEEEVQSLSKKLKETMKDKILENGTSNSIRAMNETLKQDLREAQLEIRKASSENSYLVTKYNQLVKSCENNQHSCNIIKPETRQQSRNIQVWKVDSRTKVATPVKVVKNFKHDDLVAPNSSAIYK